MLTAVEVLVCVVVILDFVVVGWIVAVVVVGVFVIVVVVGIGRDVVKIGLNVVVSLAVEVDGIDVVNAGDFVLVDETHNDLG